MDISVLALIQRNGADSAQLALRLFMDISVLALIQRNGAETESRS